MIHRDREIKARKPDIVVVNKNERSCAIIDIAITGDIRVSDTPELKREIKRMANIRSIKLIPLKNCKEELGVVISTELLQKTALLGTACILRKVLDCRELTLWV